MADPVAEASEDLVGDMATSLLGEAGGAIVGKTLNVLFGLLASPDEPTYMKQIDQKLDQITGILGQLQFSVDQLSNAVGDLQEKITDVEVQEALGRFSTNAQVIETSFQLYRSAALSLATATTTPDQRAKAESQLFELFQTSSTASISSALSNVLDAFAPLLGEQKGLLKYQFDVVLGATVDYSSNSANYAYTPSFGSGWDVVPTAGGFFFCSKIVTGSHSAATQALEDAVSGVFRAFVTVQIQGMILLNAAWIGSINTPLLAPLVDRIKGILGQIQSFSTDIVPQVNAQVASNLRKYGKPLLPPVTLIGWVYGSQRDGNSDNPCPLTNDWIMWDWAWGNYAMVYQPWVSAAQPCVFLMMRADGKPMLVNDYEGLDSDLPQTMEIPVFTAHDIPPGLNFTQQLVPSSASTTRDAHVQDDSMIPDSTTDARFSRRSRDEGSSASTAFIDGNTRTARESRGCLLSFLFGMR